MAESRPTIAQERAAAQAAARARRAERQVARAAAGAGGAAGPIRGRALVRFSLGSTAVFAVSAIAAAAVEPSSGRIRDVLVISSVVVALALGAAGVVVFVVALLWGAERSRESEMTMAGWWFLAGDVAAAPVRRALLGALAAQVVVGLVTASVRPFTELAFGTLVPVCALAVCGAWSARHGDFPPRRTASPDGATS